jgi:hypothetical protein
MGKGGGRDPAAPWNPGPGHPRHTLVVTFAPEVPGNAQLVVRTNSGTRVLYGLLLVMVALEAVIIVGALALWVIWTDVWPLLVLVSLLLFQGYFTALILREYQGLLGPQLAADHTGVWVRTGLGTRPEVVFLPWPAIDGIDVSRKGPAVRIMSRQGEGLYGNRGHWRVRSAWKRFGTPFVVDGRRSLEPVEQIAHRLHQLAQWATR